MDVRTCSRSTLTLFVIQKRMAASSSEPGPLEVHYNGDSVVRGTEALVLRDGDLQAAIQNMMSQIQDVAATQYDVEDTQQIPGMRALFKELLSMHNEVSVHTQALQDLKSKYKASAAGTDFKTSLTQNMSRILASQVFDPERSNEMKSFDKDTGASKAGDDDDVEEVGDRSVLRNEKCPLTMKSVYELTSPVCDSLEFIYDRDAIIDHIKRFSRGGQPVRCPVAGTNHIISERELKPATQIERVKRRKKLRAALAPPAAGTGEAFAVDE